MHTGEKPTKRNPKSWREEDEESSTGDDDNVEIKVEEEDGDVGVDAAALCTVELTTMEENWL